MNKVILVCPAGREQVLEIQLKYILKLLDLDIVHEYHIWDFSWNSNDSIFINSLGKLHPKIKILCSPYSNASRAGDIASKQFSYFLSDYYKYDNYNQYKFYLVDDDDYNDHDYHDFQLP